MIEQAKGMLAERYGVTVDAAFELLRRAASRSRTRVHDLARLVVVERQTPPAIELERSSASR